VPLLLKFFSEASHTAALAHPELQDVLDAAIFEPGLWQPNAPKPMPATVPAENRKHLATPTGLLFQELTHSPAVTLGCMQTLLDNALDMDAGRYSQHGASAVILYAVRLALRIEGYVRYLGLYTILLLLILYGVALWHTKGRSRGVVYCPIAVQ